MSLKDLPVFNPSGDPLRRKAEKEVAEDLPSPMDPPLAYAPPTVESIPPDQLASPLKALMQDHEDFLKVLSVFDEALVELKKREWKFVPEISSALKAFFQFMDQELPRHTRIEEKLLFPVLHEKFLATGEHSPGQTPVTPVDVMEADHAHVSQLAMLVFNLFGLAPRLRDAESRNFLFEHAFHQGQEIVEVMKLHIYKENTTLFPLAQQLLSAAEMERVADRISRV